MREHLLDLRDFRNIDWNFVNKIDGANFTPQELNDLGNVDKIYVRYAFCRIKFALENRAHTPEERKRRAEAQYLLAKALMQKSPLFGRNNPNFTDEKIHQWLSDSQDYKHFQQQSKPSLLTNLNKDARDILLFRSLGTENDPRAIQHTKYFLHQCLGHKNNTYTAKEKEIFNKIFTPEVLAKIGATYTASNAARKFFASIIRIQADEIYRHGNTARHYYASNFHTLPDPTKNILSSRFIDRDISFEQKCTAISKCFSYKPFQTRYEESKSQRFKKYLANHSKDAFFSVLYGTYNYVATFGDRLENIRLTEEKNILSFAAKALILYGACPAALPVLALTDTASMLQVFHYGKVVLGPCCRAAASICKITYTMIKIASRKIADKLEAFLRTTVIDPIFNNMAWSHSM